MNKGINQLANVFQKRMKDMNDVPPIIDFGTIQGDRSLKPDGYDIQIPYGSYSIMTNHHSCSGFKGCDGSDTCSGFKGCSGHYTWSPSSGDRCVVLWVGNEAVVIGKID